MDIRLVLSGFVLPGLALVLGLPTALGVIPQNRFYGYRTRKTMASPEVWYRANRVSGWAMVIAGAAAFTHNTLFRHDHGDWAAANQAFFMAMATVVLLLAGIGISAVYVKRM
jgi:uncharacterized membrane protein